MQSNVPNAPTPSVSIEDEVLSNLRSQKLGEGTVDDLALPEAFLRRIGDRVIRDSFEQRFRAVVTDEALAEMEADASAQRTAASAAQTSATTGAQMPPAAPSKPQESRAPFFVVGGGVLVVLLVLAVRRTRSQGKARS